ncbi:MAG TPA: ABC transporter ATP-binding protein [Candidatus Angelobacter sp.]|nr:ABC transporter ATP-binding protein [Candidatus Angelobacter sp.]
MIHCRNVTKKFRDFTALDDVSFEVPAGISALIGPNGAGKSTLLKILTGLISPDTGEVRIGGLDISSQSIEIRRIIGVVPEDLGLFDSLTIREHLEMTGPIYGLTKPQTRERMNDLLLMLGLDHARDTFLNQCSYGMRKKTALAMAILHAPRVLFLDEPFEGLDPVVSKTVQNLLLDAAKQGATIFLVSHTLSIVEQIAKEIMLIRGGRIVWTSSQDDGRRPLEDLYFELVESQHLEPLRWLHLRQS